MKTIIIACGSGIATSTLLADSVIEFCESNGISVRVIQCSISEIDSYEMMGDLIVSSTSLSRSYSIPAVNGIGFITGMGLEEAQEEILKYLS